MKRLSFAGIMEARPAWRLGTGQAGPRLAWALWVVVATAAIALTVAGVPARFRELLANTGQPLLPPLLVSSVILGLNILMAGLFIGAALWIVRLKGRAPVAFFLSLTLIAIGATETGITGALINPQHGVDTAPLRWMVLALGAVTLTGALLLL